MRHSISLNLLKIKIAFLTINLLFKT